MRTNPMNNNPRNNSWGADDLGSISDKNKVNAGLLEQRSGLSVDDFLQIMAAEMQNQSPMGDSDGGGSKTDYISQLAQFTSLEQMTEIVENLNYLNVMSQQQYAFTLIGKEVTVQAEDGTITGIVGKVKFKDGFPMVTVEGKDYHLGKINEVGDPGKLASNSEDDEEDLGDNNEL